MSDQATYILKVTCDDQPGIVSAISRCIAENDGNILECQQFDDQETKKFLMRIRFSCNDIERVEFQLRPVVERFQIKSELLPETQKGRVLIMISKMDHCLNDLMYRWKRGDLNMELAGVVSNHEMHRDQVEHAGVPFIYLPVTKDTKKEQEKSFWIG